jgi:hypothetical protein
MTKLFISNTTRQHQQLFFWIPGMNKPYAVDISSGHQREVFNGTDADIEVILEQLHPYGVKPLNEALRASASFTGLAYKLDRPLDASDVVQVHEKNMTILDDQAAEERKRMTAASVQNIERDAPALKANKFTVEVTKEGDRGEKNKPIQTIVASNSIESTSK